MAKSVYLLHHGEGKAVEGDCSKVAPLRSASNGESRRREDGTARPEDGNEGKDQVPNSQNFWAARAAASRNRERGALLHFYEQVQGADTIKISEEDWIGATAKFKNALEKKLEVLSGELQDSIEYQDPYGNSYVQPVIYEWRPSRCGNCYRFWHLKEKCPEPNFEQMIVDLREHERREAKVKDKIDLMDVEIEDLNSHIKMFEVRDWILKNSVDCVALLEIKLPDLSCKVKEKMNGAKVRDRDIQDFRNFVDKNALADIEFWEDFDNYNEMVKGCWEGSATARNLYMLQVKMKRMKSIFKGSFAKYAKDMDKRVDKAREDLLIAQVAVQQSPTDESLITQEIYAAKEFKKIKRYQLIFYQQRAKLKWFKEEDANTKFVNNIVKGKRSRNTIKSVKIQDGSFSTDKQTIKMTFVDYFKGLLGQDISPKPILTDVVRKGKTIEAGWCRGLVREVTDLEVWSVLTNIGIDKAPGPDGFSASFFKKNWRFIGLEICNSIRHCLKYNALSRGLNAPYIALIPKHNMANTPADFRPISCCNILLKNYIRSPSS
ncbi:hypothetical protein QQ045_010706 [Rhodiola kirilowii]